MIETQASIFAWREEAFGPVQSTMRLVTRLNEEVAELLTAVAVTKDEYHPKTAEEVADVAIILYTIATRLGVDLHAEIDRKMAVNRHKRVWKKDGSGHGYHVREGEEGQGGNV